MTTMGELCNRTVSIAEPRERVIDAARRMRDHHVGCLVVVEDRDGGRVPVGLVTDRDLVVGALATRPGSIEQLEVRDVMSAHPVMAREEEPLLDVLSRMRAHGVRRVPVVDRAGVLQGIFAVDDILEHVTEHLDQVVRLLGRERDHERDETSPRAS
ncbi:CBS domain-containing protein [Sandaracinus amylolyticus]|uniref:CBS domain-containing protein n=1 Tax=Sandaracinus amylolyticus TaxID=927083 RepID=UPI001F261B41|nr:CBS domain-containing protein [Sandaracinus amylolyticus]UJR84103.1 Hypothetical protein I5071_61740 [Sandaracinus amylolyticus]